MSRANSVGGPSSRNADDEAGALGEVTPDQCLAALQHARTGHVFSLAETLGPRSAVPPHRPRPARFMARDAGDYALGARTPGGFKFAEDVVQFATHSGTHVDALAHVWSGDTMYNGHPESATRSTRGASRCGAEKLPPVLTRGVLVDLVKSVGGSLPPEQAIEVDDLQRGIGERGVLLQPGDTVLVRTGWNEAGSHNHDRFTREPGITPGAASWLAEQGVVLVGADNYAFERQTAAEPGFPAHLVLLKEHGIPIIENLVLAPLADALADADRSTFLFVFAPIPLEGSTAAPVNPLAVL